MKVPTDFSLFSRPEHLCRLTPQAHKETPVHHRWKSQVLVLLVVGLLTPHAYAEDTPTPLQQMQIWLGERGGNEGPERLRILADYHSPRLNGSKELESAFQWAKDLMIRDGLSHVKSDPVKVPHWTRGEEEAHIISPVHRPVNILGLGGSPGTGDTPVEGEIIVFPSMDAMKLSSTAQVQGKIVLINQVLPPYNEETGETHYREVGTTRINGPAEAARLGASGVLVRSITAYSLNTPHTGATRFPEGVKPIPSAAIAIEDAERLDRLSQDGPVTVQLSMGAQWRRDATSQNVMGEIPGSQFPEEVVLVGAHLDTWDVGDGSMDNGCGCIMVMEAVRLLLRMPVRPRRTIRLVLFTDEEHQQRGAADYFRKYGKDHHVAAVEADLGCGAPRSFTIQGKKNDLVFLEERLPQFAAFGVKSIIRGGAGADIAPIVKGNGVPGIGIAPDASTYFHRHHSAADTLDKVSTEHLSNHARALALLLYSLAERETP